MRILGFEAFEFLSVGFLVFLTGYMLGPVEAFVVLLLGGAFLFWRGE